MNPKHGVYITGSVKGYAQICFGSGRNLCKRQN